MLRGSTIAQCTQLVTGFRWKPIWFLCVTESFSWTTGPCGTKTERSEGERGREREREEKKSCAERERERRREGGRKTGRPGPPGQTIAARWERGSRALPVPKVHSCRSGHADQNSPGLVQVLHFHRQQSLGCYGDGRNRETLFRFHVKWCVLTFFIHFERQNKKQSRKRVEKICIHF